MESDQNYFFIISELDPSFIEQICTNAKKYENRWIVCLEFQEDHLYSECICYGYLAPFFKSGSCKELSAKTWRTDFPLRDLIRGPRTEQDWRPITVI